MEAYQERVIKERDELQTKITALNAFILGDSAKTLSPRDMSHLIRQHRTMVAYSNILDTRIFCFTSDIITEPMLDVKDSQPIILRGIGRRPGDGWKDTTKIGQVAFVWNDPMPLPYAANHFPRVGCEIWAASTDQYDFVPATVEEVRELFTSINANRNATAITANQLTAVRTTYPDTSRTFTHLTVGNASFTPTAEYLQAVVAEFTTKETPSFDTTVCISEISVRYRERLVISVGDPNWTPTKEELDDFVTLFQNASLDNGVVATRTGVTVTVVPTRELK